MKDLKKIAQILKEAQSSFYYFTKTIFKAGFPQFVDGKYIREVCDYLQKYKRTMRVAARSHFKCLRKGTLIPLANGIFKKIEEIQPSDEVLALQNNKIVPTKVLRQQATGYKQLLRIETSTNLYLDTSFDHLFLTPRGWKRAEDLKVGDYVVVSRKEIDPKIEVASEDFEWQEIKKIRQIGIFPTYDLETEAQNYLANGIVVHNSTSFYAYIQFLIMFQGFKRDLDIYYFSFNESQAGWHISNIKSLIAKNPFFAELRNLKPLAENVAAFTWNNQHIIRIKPKGITSFTRGTKADFIFLDDIYADPTSQTNPTVILKINDIFRSVILEAIKPEGEIHVVGCVSKDTRILTSKGLEKIGDLDIPSKPNTYRKLLRRVYGIDGFHSTTHSYNEGISKTKKITTSSGFTIECSLEHPLLTLNKEGKQVWKRAKDIKIGDWLAIQKNQQEFGFDETLSEDEAYLMGLWIAEGSYDGRNRKIQRLTITNSEPEIGNFLKRMGWQSKSARSDQYRKTDIELINRWKKLGVKFGKSFEKTVPEIIFKSRKKIVIKFLQGLFDGDGSNTERGIILSSTSKQLIQEVQIILLLFGIIGDIRENKPGINPKRNIIGRRPCYSLVLDGIDYERFLKEINFGLKRKQGLKRKRIHNSGHLIPYQGRLLKEVLIKSPGGKASDIINHRNLAYSETLEELISDPYKVKFNKFYCQLRNNLKYFWDRVKKIEDSENEVVDLVIPETHSFFSNGFISHNSPLSRADIFFEPDIQKEFHVRFYPAITHDENGNEVPTWPEFYTLEEIKKKREVMGEKAFAREVMCQPFYSTDAFFKKEILRKTIVNPSLRNIPLHEGLNTQDLVIAGLDIGKKAHPSVLNVFRVTNNKAIQIHRKKMINWPYYSGKSYDPLHPTQLEYCKAAIKAFGIDALYYDNTRGEFEGAKDAGLLTPQFIPVVFTPKNRIQMATNFEKIVLNRQIEIFDDEEMLNSICSVTNELKKIATPEGHCYDDETEILTEKGWKLFKDLDKNDKVATLKNGRELEYQRPTQIIEEEYEGKMYEIDSEQINLKVSPNHRMYVGTSANNWRIKKPSEIYHKQVFFKKDFEWKGKEETYFILPEMRTKNGRYYPELKIDMDTWLAFLGIYLTEGDTPPERTSVRIHQKKGENYKKIARILKKLPFNVKEKERWFEINNAQLARFTKTLGRYSYLKHIPTRFKMLSRRQLKILFDSLILGDGTRKTYPYRRKETLCFYTSSKQLADDIQEIGLKIGYISNILVRDQRGRPAPHGITRRLNYRLNFFKQKGNFCINKKKFSDRWVDYRGKIYCVSVPNRIIYVRRKGKACWCGNSDDFDSFCLALLGFQDSSIIQKEQKEIRVGSPSIFGDGWSNPPIPRGF